MLKNQFRIAIFVAALSLHTGCQKDIANSPRALSKILKINNEGDIASINPHTGVDIISRIVQSAIYEGLLRIGPDNKPQLAGAQSVDIDSSQTRYTFTLRPHTWSNGKRVTAHDYVRSWKEALTFGSSCVRPDLFYPLKNGEKIAKREAPIDSLGVYAQDDQTLIVELENPTPYFLQLLSVPIFFPIYEQSESPTVFNGPFCVENWEHGSQISFVKNPTYWDADTVQLDGIVFSFVDDANTALLMYEKGELDWIGYPFTLIPSDAVPVMLARDQLTLQDVANTYWLCINTEKFPYHNTKIRKALSMAIDRDELTQSVLPGELPAFSIIPNSMRLSDTDIFQQECATELFEAGLRELNLTREEFPPIQYNYGTFSGQKKVAEALQQIWEQTFGIRVNLHESEPAVHFANLCSQNYQIGGTAWFTPIDDPIYFLDFFKKRSHYYNASAWESIHYQKLLQNACQEKDAQRRRTILHEAELLIMDQVPVIPIFQMQSKYLKSPKIKNLFISDLGHADFKWASIEE